MRSDQLASDQLASDQIASEQLPYASNPPLLLMVEFTFVTDENSVMNQQFRKILRIILVCVSVSALVYCYCINADRSKLSVTSVKKTAFSGEKR